MLSEAERRRLQELDELMITDAPALAEACRDMRLPSRSGRSRQLVAVLSGILAVVVLISSVVLHEAAFAALGLLLAGNAVLQHVRIHCEGRWPLK